MRRENSERAEVTGSCSFPYRGISDLSRHIFFPPLENSCDRPSLLVHSVAVYYIIHLNRCSNLSIFFIIHLNRCSNLSIFFIIHLNRCSNLSIFFIIHLNRWGNLSIFFIIHLNRCVTYLFFFIGEKMEEALIEIQSLMKDLVEKTTVSRDLSILPSCSYFWRSRLWGQMPMNTRFCAARNTPVLLFSFNLSLFSSRLKLKESRLSWRRTRTATF